MEEFYADPIFIARERRKARKLRQEAWWKRKLARGTCYYCQEHFSPKALTMDHIIPLGRGGTSIKINIASACKKCNNAKKNLLPHEWESYLEKLKRENQ